MNRAELQALAEERALDAEALFDAGRFSGAYYLAGYAVECGLKACIAKATSQFDFPDKDLAQKCYTHKIETLIEVAGLELQRQVDMKSNLALGKNWLIVKNWDEKSRYRNWSQLQADSLVSAVSHSTDGVLAWIRGHW